MDLDALISLIRRGGPPAASPTANEREAIFHHATARLESGTARRRTGPTGWTGTWRRSASLAVAVVVTVALGATAAIVVTHLGGRARVKPTGTTGPSKHHVNHKHPGHPNPVAVLDRTCAAAPSDPQVVAYVVRAFYTQPSQPDQVAAIDLPSGRLAWSRPLPDHLSSIAALAVAPNGKTVYAVASGSAQFARDGVPRRSRSTDRQRPGPDEHAWPHALLGRAGDLAGRPLRPRRPYGKRRDRSTRALG